MADAAYLVRDLLFVSKITESADHYGVPAQGARDADALLAAARGTRLVIVDLGHRDAMRAFELLAGDPDTAGVESIGFVGHRELDVMETAKALGVPNARVNALAKRVRWSLDVDPLDLS